jgi:hypothetical protein
MTKDEMTSLLSSVGCDENTITAMGNAYEMGVEYEREACANAMARIVMTPTLTHGALVKLSDVVNAIRARRHA